ncbi:hypothetical protein FJTKL_15628 [Diaporthe vaccinii]|uniref:Protein kinase domain-containing protein n=1 Tax=Diaporthe vaccinii TaxID=105482 RepID=A0ABR4F7A8_9PEZI
MLVVQSVQTGELFAQKLLRPSGNPDYPGYEYEEPLELRISTWQDTLRSNEFPNDVALGVLPRDAPFFNKLRFWQHFTPDDELNMPAYSLYFEKRAVSEHFIWLVAEQLCLAIAWLHFGERPDVPGHQAPANWKILYHRDPFANNVFINYPPRRGGRVPAAGEEANAFPQIVLGDFGNSAADGDDTMLIPLNVLGGEDTEDTELRLWEDTYGIGDTLRRLCQAHLRYERGDEDVHGTADWYNRRPNNIRMADLNARDGSVPDFSDQLVDLLGNFEWDSMEAGTDIQDLEDPLADVTADSRWMVDTLYPAARDRVAAYRNPIGGRPAGYFDGLDVSWTKPDPVMPFVYNTRYAHHATTAPDPVGGRVPDVDWSNEELVRMSALGRLHEWDDVKPSYELRSLEFNGPTIKPSSQPLGEE